MQTRIVRAQMARKAALEQLELSRLMAQAPGNCSLKRFRNDQTTLPRSAGKVAVSKPILVSLLQQRSHQLPVRQTRSLHKAGHKSVSTRRTSFASTALQCIVEGSEEAKADCHMCVQVTMAASLTSASPCSASICASDDSNGESSSDSELGVTEIASSVGPAGCVALVSSWAASLVPWLMSAAADCTTCFPMPSMRLI